MKNFLFSLIAISFIVIVVRCSLTKDIPDWIVGREGEIPTETIVNSLNGIDTVVVEFQYDDLIFIPVMDGYLIYSEISQGPCVDHLFLEDAKSFLWWVLQYPIQDDYDYQDSNDYYRELLLEKIYN